MTTLTGNYQRGKLIYFVGAESHELTGDFAVDRRRVLRWNARRQVGVHVADADAAYFVSTADARLNGVVRCDCGAKYWNGGHCVDCGSKAGK